MTARSLPAIEAMGRQLRAGVVTAAELAASALARIETHGRRLNAVAAFTTERALAEANQADAELRAGIDRGPLHGIPYGAKDLLAAVGYPTTWGAAPLRDQMFDEDAAVVGRLKEAGAVLVAKLATVELAGGFGYDQSKAAWTGSALNARDPSRWAGGSSSGSGAAVAAGLVPFAIGTETWGSIVVPACLNGVVGFRPTSGLVSRRGAMALSWSMDKIGPLATSALDCATVLAAIAGPDPDDAAAPNAGPFAADPRRGGYRIGVPRGAGEGCDPGVGAAFDRALAKLAGLGTVEPVDLPDLPWDEAAGIVIAAEAASAFEEFVLSGQAADLSAPEDRIGLLDALTIPAVDYLRALRVRRRGARALDALMASYDVLAAPALPRVAPPVDEPIDAWFGDRAFSLGAAGNLCGLPAAAVPIGLAEDGLPAGIELMGRRGEDGTVLAVAAALQDALGPIVYPAASS
jgi:aspartyl-tRNA(Asn)/glutamyl-tRNA(Gln) amidotransferase subunit A